MSTAGKPQYDKQRKRVNPPHLAIGDVRKAVGITIEELLRRIEVKTGRRYTKGAISALEHGVRGGSADLLEAIACAYGLDRDAFDTKYQPRAGKAAA